MSQHIIELREDGWGLEHTFACRSRGSLLDCPIHRAVNDLMDTLDGPPEPPGRYVVSLFHGEPQFAWHSVAEETP